MNINTCFRAILEYFLQCAEPCKEKKLKIDEEDPENVEKDNNCCCPIIEKFAVN